MYTFKFNDSLYDWISSIVENKLYFGPFPNQLMIDRLIEEKFDLIVNLTQDNEEEKYIIEQKNYLSFPITDNSFPISAIEYCSFITKLKYEYLIGKKIYIHCRGGHGRSSIVSVSLLSSIFDYDLKKSIEIVANSHNNRIVLRNKWKKRKTSFNYVQYMFLTKIHKNIYLSFSKHNKYYNWLSIKEDDSVYKNKDYVYNNFYEFITNLKISDYNTKFLYIYEYFNNRISNNRDLKNKFEFTYLRKFILDEDSDLSKVYYDVINSIREHVLTL